MSEAVQTEIRELAAAGVEISLCGSRSKVWWPKDYVYAFKPLGSEITPETDWDFAAAHTDLTNRVLLGRNYTVKEDLSYRDVLTAFVYEKTLEDGSVVQVASKLNLDDFKLFWKSIPGVTFQRLLWKRGPNNLTGDQICDNINHLYWFYLRLKETFSVSSDLLWE